MALRPPETHHPPPQPDHGGVIAGRPSASRREGSRQPLAHPDTFPPGHECQNGPWGPEQCQGLGSMGWAPQDLRPPRHVLPGPGGLGVGSCSQGLPERICIPRWEWALGWGVPGSGPRRCPKAACWRVWGCCSGCAWLCRGGTSTSGQCPSSPRGCPAGPP